MESPSSSLESLRRRAPTAGSLGVLPIPLESSLHAESGSGGRRSRRPRGETPGAIQVESISSPAEIVRKDLSFHCRVAGGRRARNTFALTRAGGRNRPAALSRALSLDFPAPSKHACAARLRRIKLPQSLSTFSLCLPLCRHSYWVVGERVGRLGRLQTALIASVLLQVWAAQTRSSTHLGA